MFLHKAIDLTDWEAAGFAILQSHGNQTAEKNPQKKNHYLKVVQRIFRRLGRYYCLS